MDYTSFLEQAIAKVAQDYYNAYKEAHDTYGWSTIVGAAQFNVYKVLSDKVVVDNLVTALEEIYNDG